MERRTFCEVDLLQYCPSLISISEAQQFGETVKKVHLAHFLVKEYLLRDERFESIVSSVTIIRTCLVYLTDAEGTYDSIRTHFPLATHAAEILMGHAKLAEMSKGIAEETVSFLQENTTLKRWQGLY